MAASLSLRVYTGSGAASESAPQTGADLVSTDNDSNSLGNRQANPITVGTNSYEKWVKLKVDTAPANAVTNFKMWGSGSVQTSTVLMFTAGYVTGATPTNAASTVADTTFVNFTSGNKADWDTASYTATDDVTKYAVFQLQVGADAAPGNWEQVTVNYSYDET